jgi:hypothetical protein
MLVWETHGQYNMSKRNITGKENGVNGAFDRTDNQCSVECTQALIKGTVLNKQIRCARRHDAAVCGSVNNDQ